MKQLFFLASAFSLMLATGCGTKPEAQVGTSTEASPVNVSQLSQGTTPANPVTATTTQQPVTTTTNNAQVPVNITPQPTTTASGAGLNPAHGQPGHRCDISVGAPLNSAPNKNNIQAQAVQSPTTVTQSPTVNSSAPSTTFTAPGMNPAHGQPGHKCEIPVGSPLNSVPAAKPTVTTTPIVTTLPAKKDSN
ncbi:MAG: hypothetical protein H7Y01_08875 [Ferruginibacter sp.]|nr:hypothetical protein [Chitinophagaceae bacterium]